MGTESSTMNENYNWLVEDSAFEEIELIIDESFKAKVKIMDANGNVIKEILKADFNTNNMEVSDYKMLSGSSHMFDYLGDTYYLLEN
ncbi:MAG: hypothetical protein HKN48_09780 [Flavobacteriaceae bacterium]|nr:hypothetical protein [Flavobacteriaceae bacterium]